MNCIISGTEVLPEGRPQMKQTPREACVASVGIAVYVAVLILVPNLLAGWATVSTRIGVEQQAIERGGLQSSAPATAAAQSGEHTRVWLGPDGNALPFKTDDEVLEFLRTAKVVSMQNIPVGVTRPRQAVLEKDGIRSRAIFRDVDSEMESFQVGGRRERVACVAGLRGSLHAQRRRARRRRPGAPGAVGDLRLGPGLHPPRQPGLLPRSRPPRSPPPRRSRSPPRPRSPPPLRPPPPGRPPPGLRWSFSRASSAVQPSSTAWRESRILPCGSMSVTITVISSPMFTISSTLLTRSLSSCEM